MIAVTPYPTPAPSVLALPPVASGPITLDVVHHCKAEDLLAALPTASVDLVVTSPPYDNLRRYNGFSWDFERIARETYRVLKPGGVLVWVVGDSVVDGSETLTSFKQATYFVDRVHFRLHQTLIFADPGCTFPDPTRYTRQSEFMFVFSKGRPKTIHLQTQRNKYAGAVKRHRWFWELDGTKSVRGEHIVPEYGVMGSIWTLPVGLGHSASDNLAFDHPAIFPEELARRHILTWSNPGDVVLDYFGGSGTTAKMARSLGRRYITCDISAEYCDLMRRRLAQPYTVPFDALFAAPAPVAAQQTAFAF